MKMDEPQQRQLLMRLATDTAQGNSVVMFDHVIHKRDNVPHKHGYHYWTPNAPHRQVFAFAGVRPRVGYPIVSIMEKPPMAWNARLFPHLRRVWGREWNGYSWIGEPDSMGDAVYHELACALRMAKHACFCWKTVREL